MFLCLTLGAALHAQKTRSGLDLRETFSGLGAASNELSAAPRSGSSFAAGFRSITYPTWKVNANWSVMSAYQFVTRPYFFDDSAARVTVQKVT